MKRPNKLTLFAILLTGSLVAGNASAQTDTLVEIRNISSEARKICMFKANEKVMLFPYKCLELNSGGKVIWSREGDRSNFKVTVSKPALIDKYLYTRNLPGRTTTIVMGEGGRFGYSTDKANPPVTKYRLRVCNPHWDDTVYFTIGFETNGGFFAEGWWNLAKGKCMDVDVSERLKRIIGLEYGNMPRTYYYARTYGKFPQEWRGGTEGQKVCVDNTKAFRIFLERGNDGNYLPSPCDQSVRKEVSFRRLDDPKTDQEYYFLTF